MASSSKRTLFLLAACLPSTVATTAFYINNDFSCGSMASVSIESATCNSAETCSMGETLTTTGSITFNTDMPTDAKLSVKACFMGMNIDSLCKTYTDDSVDLCTEIGLTSTDGSECPAAGTYTYDATINLPNYSVNYGYGWWVSLVTVIEDNDGVVETITCTSSIKARNGTSMTWSGAALGIAALALAVAGVQYRKRRTAKIDLLAEERVVGGNFEMMTDRGVTV